MELTANVTQLMEAGQTHRCSPVGRKGIYTHLLISKVLGCSQCILSKGNETRIWYILYISYIHIIPEICL